MPEEDNPIFSNGFGTVYADRIVFCSKKGWFGGGVLELLRVYFISSVRIETARDFFTGLILAVLAIPLLASGSAIEISGGLILAPLGILLLIGWPVLTINSTYGASQWSSRTAGGVWQKKAAAEFVAAVHKAMLDK